MHFLPTFSSRVAVEKTEQPSGRNNLDEVPQNTELRIAQLHHETILGR